MSECTPINTIDFLEPKPYCSRPKSQRKSNSHSFFCVFRNIDIIQYTNTLFCNWASVLFVRVTKTKKSLKQAKIL